MAVSNFSVRAEEQVHITHPEKQLFTTPPTTKLAYLQYLVRVAPLLLKHLEGRALTLVRCPNGTKGNRFYQKHVLPGTPDYIPFVETADGEREIVISNMATLLFYGNMGSIEFHAALAKRKEGTPTSLSFDLDPSVDDFERVRQVALHLRDTLGGLGLNSLVKTSGATGLQVFTPLANPVPFADTKRVVHFIAKYMEQRWPAQVTTARLVRDRSDKVYVDAPQHGETRTLIAPYSVRATPFATVSTPISWQELEEGVLPTDFTIRNVPERTETLGDLYDAIQPSTVEPILAWLNRQR